MNTVVKVIAIFWGSLMAFFPALLLVAFGINLFEYSGDHEAFMQAFVDIWFYSTAAFMVLAVIDSVRG